MSTRENRGTLPRSFTEIEVDFARIQVDKRRSARGKGISQSKPDRSFSVRKQHGSGRNSQEDTEGSSIIDLRDRRVTHRQSHSSYFIGDRRLDKNRSLRQDGQSSRRKTTSSDRCNNYVVEHKMSFHTSLQNLSSSDDHQTPPRKFFSNDDLSMRRPRNGTPFKHDQRDRGQYFHRQMNGIRRQQINMKSSSTQSHLKIKTFPNRNTKGQFGSSGSMGNSSNVIASSNTKNGLRHQILATVSSSTALLACGFAAGFSLAKNSQNNLESSIGSLSDYTFITGAIVGALISGCVSNLGRKIPLFFCMSLLMLGWISVIFTTEPWITSSFHGISGGCTSLTLVLTQIYVAEISMPNFRGSLSSIPLLCLYTGALLCFITDGLLTWKSVAITGVILIAPFFVSLVLCLPESPRFLVHKNPNEALAMLQWLRGCNKDVVHEYQKMADNFPTNQWSLHKSDLKKSAFLTPLMISCVLMFLYSMSGAESMVFYNQIFFEEISFEYKNISHIILISISIIGIVVNVLLVDQIGRKLLLLLSLTIMAASAFALGLFSFLKNVHKIDTHFIYQRAAEMFCIVLFTLAHGSALGPITWLTMGEIFGTRLRWIGVSLASMVMWSSLILANMTYYNVSIVIATGGLFWFHCIVCVGGYIFILIFFRELRGHPMDDVADVFMKKNESLIDTFITKA